MPRGTAPARRRPPRPRPASSADPVDGGLAVEHDRLGLHAGHLDASAPRSPAYRLPRPARRPPSRVATTASAASRLGAWPVTAAMNSSRSSASSRQSPMRARRRRCGARRAPARSRRSSRRRRAPPPPRRRASPRPRPTRSGRSGRRASPCANTASPAATSTGSSSVLIRSSVASGSGARNGTVRSQRQPLRAAPRRGRCRPAPASTPAPAPAAAAPVATSAPRIPTRSISSGASAPPMPEGQREHRLEHAEHAAQHLVRGHPLQQRAGRPRRPARCRCRRSRSMANANRGSVTTAIRTIGSPQATSPMAKSPASLPRPTSAAATSAAQHAADADRGVQRADAGRRPCRAGRAPSPRSARRALPQTSVWAPNRPMISCSRRVAADRPRSRRRPRPGSRLVVLALGAVTGRDAAAAAPATRRT